MKLCRWVNCRFRFQSSVSSVLYIDYNTLKINSFLTILDALNTRRQEVLGKIVSTLLDHLNDYIENQHCSFECDALMVGSLTKRLHTLKVLPHCPDPTYNDLCFEDFTYRFRNGMYFPAAQRTSTHYYSHGKCAIDSIDRMLSQCEERLGGMELSDFKIIPWHIYNCIYSIVFSFFVSVCFSYFTRFRALGRVPAGCFESSMRVSAISHEVDVSFVYICIDHCASPRGHRDGAGWVFRIE